MPMRTPLSRAKGLGSAGEGAGHWWSQRVTAVALVPLVLWLAFSVAGLSGAGYGEAKAWVAMPLNAALLALFLVAAFYHAVLGLQVVIEDYVHTEGLKILCLLVVQFGFWFLGAYALWSLVRIVAGA